MPIFAPLLKPEPDVADSDGVADPVEVAETPAIGAEAPDLVVCGAVVPALVVW